MGICLTSRKSSYSFEMGYCGFNNLRINICKMHLQKATIYRKELWLFLLTLCI